jgi:hypothetical protein
MLPLRTIVLICVLESCLKGLMALDHWCIDVLIIMLVPSGVAGAHGGVLGGIVK